MPNNLILVTGAGGFIGGHLVNHFLKKGHPVRAVDKKPIPEWLLIRADAENLCLDLSFEENCRRAAAGAQEVYNLAADMGGMGFIERFRVECMRSVLINTHMIEAAFRAGAERYFFASSACIYNTALQTNPEVTALKEADAMPALAERGYGWEKLFGELVCQEYWAERGLKTFVARLHNAYGPFGTWDGGREKAPAALCRKVIEAIDRRSLEVDIWGDGHQTRSFMFIEDCITGIDKITHCEDLIARPINLGSNELVTINDLLTKIEKIDGVGLNRRYDLGAPRGVAGRNSDNTLIREVLGWEPHTSLDDGLLPTYHWINKQYYARKQRRQLATALA